MDAILNYLTETSSLLEMAGVVTSLLYIYLSVKETIWLWIMGFISSAIYTWVFFQSRLYADSGLYVYYMSMSIYGWVVWYRGNRDTGGSDDLSITRTGKRAVLYYTLAGILLFLLIYAGLSRTNSDVPVGDAFTTSLSIVATYMLAHKKLEHWLVWIMVDAFATGLYIYKSMYPTAFLFLVYTILAVWGYFRWRKIA